MHEPRPTALRPAQRSPHGPANRRLVWRRPLPRLEALRRTTVDVGAYRVHSVQAGTGEECVVLLHGLSGSSRWWFRNLEAFAARFRVFVPDVIGFGRTRRAGPLPDIPGVAAVLAEWMEAVGAPRAHVVGHSMGGQLALHLAARFPGRVERLVLVDAAGIPRPLGPRGLLRFAREVSPPRRWGDPAFLPVILGDSLRAGPLTVLRALSHIVRDDVRPLLGEVEAPTLVVWGEGDHIVPLEHGRTMRERIPGSRLLVLKRAAHNPMVDRPEDFNAAVLSFLGGEEVGE